MLYTHYSGYPNCQSVTSSNLLQKALFSTKFTDGFEQNAESLFYEDFIRALYCKTFELVLYSFIF